MRRETPEAILDQCCAMLKSVLFTEEIEWAVHAGTGDRRFAGIVPRRESRS